MKTQQQLEEEIIYLNDCYREGNPVVSDQEYDKLLSELKILYPNSTILKRGIIENNKSRKEKLPVRMTSLNKTTSLQELKQWIKSKNIPLNEEVIITPKFDGISLVEDGLKLCWTRGDGEFGQRSDEHFKMIQRKLAKSMTIGEAIISKENWNKYFFGKLNPHSGESYKNPRNTVAGLFNREEIFDELKYIDFIRYTIPFSHEDKINQIISLNQFNIYKVKYLRLSIVGLLNIKEDEFTQMHLNWSQEYNIDGLVIDINSNYNREKLGYETNGNPAFAVALKLPVWNTGYTTKVTDISWQVSKQGKLKPVINIEPVNIDGVTVSNVTGYNAKYIFDNNIYIDSEIEITRSGDVIPKHLQTLSFIPENGEKLADELAECPCCGELTIWDKTMTELICQNPECKDKQINKILHFFNIMGIEDIGEPSVRQLYELGITTIPMYFILTIEELSKIEGWGEKSASRLINQLNDLIEKPILFAKLLHALDLFEGVLGEKDAQLIFDSEIEDYTLENIQKIKGIGKITAEAFLKGLENYNPDLYIFKNIFLQEEKRSNKEGKFVGWYICMTGFRSDEIQTYIEQNSGVIVSGVSKNTTHLLVKDINSTSSKTQKAKELGITIISKEEFETKYM